MRTNIVLDDRLVRTALKFVKVKTKKALIHMALREFVANHSRQDLRDLQGKVSFREGYDYKALRQRPAA